MSAIEVLESDEVFDPIAAIMCQMARARGLELETCSEPDFVKLVEDARAQYYRSTGDRRALPPGH